MRFVRAAAAAALLCAGLAACSSGGVASGSGSGSGSSASDSPVSAQVAATSQDVSFTVDGTKTYGTLEIPAHRSGQHLAAALLLAGSGPTDRDGDQPSQKVTPQTLKLVAEELARQGIMTLRFDKYFTGQTGAGAFASDPGNIDLNAYIRQADAAYAFLGAQPTADRQHLLVVGHSEGGFYAMLVADTVSPHPAGLALIEPQDQRILRSTTRSPSSGPASRWTRPACCRRSCSSSPRNCSPRGTRRPRAPTTRSARSKPRPR